MPRYIIWTIGLSGDRRDMVAEYSNRGHAMARLRGLRRRAWLAALDGAAPLTYTIQKG